MLVNDPYSRYCDLAIHINTAAVHARGVEWHADNAVLIDDNNSACASDVFKHLVDHFITRLGN